MRTLNCHSQTRENNFDLLRLIAAIAVIFSHAYPLTGNNNLEPLARISHGFTTIGGLAVACFFIISGFLITASFCQRKHISSYFVARCLRIFPGLIAALVFCILIIGPLVTTLSLHDYLRQLLAFRSNHFILPGVFTTNVYPNAVNGSLWTLPIEFLLYIFIGLLGLSKLIPFRWFASFLIILLIVPCLFDHSRWLAFIPQEGMRAIVPMACFGIGALFYLWKDKIPLYGVLLLPALLILAGLRHSHYFEIWFYFTFAYAIFWLAYQQKIKGAVLTRYGDFSYGIYIYAFPVQQLLMWHFAMTSPYQLFSLALPITLLLAIGSWYLIEKPALALKNSLTPFYKPLTTT